MGRRMKSARPPMLSSPHAFRIERMISPATISERRSSPSGSHRSLSERWRRPRGTETLASFPSRKVGWAGSTRMVSAATPESMR